MPPGCICSPGLRGSGHSPSEDGITLSACEVCSFQRAQLVANCSFLPPLPVSWEKAVVQFQLYNKLSHFLKVLLSFSS